LHVGFGEGLEHWMGYMTVALVVFVDVCPLDSLVRRRVMKSKMRRRSWSMAYSYSEQVEQNWFILGRSIGRKEL